MDGRSARRDLVGAAPPPESERLLVFPEEAGSGGNGAKVGVMYAPKVGISCKHPEIPDPERGPGRASRAS